MDKAGIRKTYRDKRSAITPQQKARLDDLLLIRFQQLAVENVQVLLSYWPLDHVNEPDTHLFTRYLHHMVPQLQTAYPVCDTAGSHMEALATNDDTIFVTNAWGITEPRAGSPVDPGTIDLVFVPLLAFDQNGYRVGFGKGYYDRFLARCREDVLKIGFSYFDPLPQISDLDGYDVPLNYCITPEKIYEF
jgi:5-formyltetrahydrofolate cyclo-ligase